MPTKKYNNFDMTIEECKNVLDTIDRLIVVDSNHKIQYISPDILKLMEIVSMKDLTNVIGKKIEDIHPLSKISKVLASGEAMDQCYYFSGGITNVARIKPIIDNGKVVGAVDYDIFGDDGALKKFLGEIIELAQNGVIDFAKDVEDMIRKSIEASKKIRYKVGSIKGESGPIRKLRQQIYDLSESESTVLITGETGSGKELIVQAIHGVSRRSQNKLVEINCAAIPESLAESELFGYEEGSFTGAQKGGKQGKFELANGGTVFLDEIDHLPYHVQPKLLRFLQEREIDRVGGSESIPINIRLITATNKNLKELVKEGKFREDLYYRLNVVEIKVPNLRERKDDIPALVEEAIARINPILGKSIHGISSDALALLGEYDWPGNVRELFNIIERAMNRCKEEELRLDHFDDFAFQISKDKVKNILGESNYSLEKIRDVAETDAIHYVLNLTKGNISQAAKMLNISRPALYGKIKKLNVKIPE